MTTEIQVGDFVKLTADNGVTGRVQDIRGDNVRIKTSWNEDRIYTKAALTRVSGGLGAIFAKPGVSLTEIGANALVFSAGSKIMKQGWFGPDVKRFIVADILTEVYAHDMMVQNGIVIFKREDMTPLTGDDATSFMPSGIALKMAGNKLLTVAVVDSILRLIQGVSQKKRSYPKHSANLRSSSGW